MILRLSICKDMLKSHSYYLSEIFFTIPSFMPVGLIMQKPVAVTVKIYFTFLKNNVLVTLMYIKDL